MALYHKYRPQSFDQIYGNKETLSLLEAELEKEEKAHAILLSGPTGCGKTTLARIIAKELGAVGNDYREIDSADFRGIDTVREIRKQSQFKPLESPCRVWLIDECHQMSRDGQSALLKALEDTPKHVYYILATTDPDKLLETIKGRCAQFSVTPLSDRDMHRLLRHVVNSEGEQLSREIYAQIIQDSQGHARNALQILDQVLSVAVEKRLEIAKQTAEQQSQVIALCRVLITPVGWRKVAYILSGLKKEDPERIRRAVLGYCSAILLKEENDRVGIVMEEMEENLYSSGFPGLVLRCYRIVNGEE